ncbi:uncharacterized protein LOC142143165 [Mixophyes fleayi]|uniref:uncharacterized protein LOC142143165 n=1 Tax=Mixophyes fleayi TaxID=3061075 RepID=UPI003F4E1512
MPSTLVIEILICSLWYTKSSAIFSLTSSPLFTMESLNDTKTEEPEQAFTVPLELDLERTETDPVTDGGTKVSSQTAITSTVTPVLKNATGGVENNIKPQELSTTSIDPTQPISLDVFSMPITESAVTALDSASKETGNNSTLIPLLDSNKDYPFDEHFESYLEIPMENSTAGKQCSCNIPGPEGQKGDKGDRGDPGHPGKIGKRGPQGLEGAKGELGLQGPKGETGRKGGKGETGPIGPKGEPGVNCVLCEKIEQGITANDGTIELRGNKGEPGNKGIKGDMGTKGDPGEKGSMGFDGIPGIPGEVGPQGPMGQRGSAGLKGDRGIPGATGPPGYSGPPGIPGRKGERGPKGVCAEHENIAFSVAFRGNRNILLPRHPMRFDKVFVNENKPYNVNSGIFVANVEGIYFFTYQISSSYQSVIVGLTHNGKIVVQTRTWQSENNVCQASGSVLLHLREDDEIWLQALSVAQSELISDESTSIFSGFLLYSLED